MQDNKFKVLCAIQILRVDKPKITGDEIAFELNNQGLRRVNGKLWNKGTVNHLIANAEKETEVKPVINPIKQIEVVQEVVQTIPRQEPEDINPYSNILISSVGPKPEKTLIEKSIDSRRDLVLQTARDMNIEWRKCLERKSAINIIINDEIDQREKLRAAAANAIYWSDDCQDIEVEKSFFYERVLGFKSLEDFKSTIIPIKLRCIETKDCNNSVIIKDRKDRNKIRCDYHQITFDYYQYIASPEWKIKSNETMDRDGFACRTCDSPENLRVHHKTYVRLKNELPTDLITLCKKCDNVIEPIRREVAKNKKQSYQANQSEEPKKKVLSS